MIIKGRIPGLNFFLFFNIISLAQAQTLSQTQGQDQAKDLAQFLAQTHAQAQAQAQSQSQSQGQDPSKVLAQSLPQAQAEAQVSAQTPAQAKAQSQSQSQGQDQSIVLAQSLPQAQAQAQAQVSVQAPAPAQAQAQSQSQVRTPAKFLAQILAHALADQAAQAQAQEQFNTQAAESLKQTVMDHVYTVNVISHQPNIGPGSRKTDYTELEEVYDLDSQRSQVGTTESFGNRPQSGSAAGAEYQDDTESDIDYKNDYTLQDDSEATFGPNSDTEYYPTDVHQEEENDVPEEEDEDIDDSGSEKESVEVCSTIRGETCLFPYVHNGYTHYECTTISPVGNTTFGRCPTSYLDESAKLPSLKAEDWERCSTRCPLQAYTSNQKINQILRDTVASNLDLVQLLDVGVSVNDQPILGVAISAGVRNRAQLRPMVKYIGNIHGNEPVGRELLVHLIRVLVQGYKNGDQRITNLLETTNITIIPTMNPDGFDRSKEGECSGGDFKTGRYNEGNKDLNRDFPTWRDVKNSLEENMKGRQPETQALMKLITSEPWVLSANFHGGAVVASYPYDDYYSGMVPRGIHQTEDHAFFKHLASTYADNHLTMKDTSKCTKWRFEDGITNGADWYALVGGMQDFNYIYSNGMEITLEVSCCKYPKKYYLNQRWDENRESLFAYIEQVHRGFKGLVSRNLREKESINISNANIEVQNLGTGIKTRNVRSSNLGEYWKLLLPGQYSIRGIENRCESSGFKFTSDYIQMNVTELQPLVQINLDLIHRENCSEKTTLGIEE